MELGVECFREPHACRALVGRWSSHYRLPVRLGGHSPLRSTTNHGTSTYWTGQAQSRAAALTAGAAGAAEPTEGAGQAVGAAALHEALPGGD